MNTTPLAPTKEERTWALAAHLSAFAMYFTGFGHIIGPLVVWLIKRDTLPFVDDQAKEALNFQISWTIYLVANFALFCTIIGAVVAVPLFFVLPIFHVVCMIVAAVRSNDGLPYRYPMTIRFVN